MPDTDTAAVLEAPAAPAPSPESAQGSRGAAPYQRIDFDSLWEAGSATTPAALSGDGVPPAETASTASDGKPAAGDDPARATPSEQPEAAAPDEASSRRRNVGAEKDAEIARLTAERDQILADRDAAIEAARVEARAPAQPATSSTVDAEQAALAASAEADASRYRTLLQTPDADLSVDDYQWREDRKALLRRYPEAERHFRVAAEQQIAEIRQTAATGAETAKRTVLNGVAAAFHTLSDLPGVDGAAFRTLPDTEALGRALHAAGYETGKAEIGAENARLRKENDELRSAALGAARAPVSAGRSAAAATDATAFNPRRSWRDNFDDVLAS